MSLDGQPVKMSYHKTYNYMVSLQYERVHVTLDGQPVKMSDHKPYTYMVSLEYECVHVSLDRNPQFSYF